MIFEDTSTEILIFVTTSIISTIVTVGTIIVRSIASNIDQKRLALMENITKERSRWIESTRLEISDFLKNARIFLLIRDFDNLNDIDSERSWASLSETCRLANQIALRLNPTEDLELQNQIEKLRSEIMYNEKFESKNFEILSESILKKSQLILKREWEKIKKETTTLKL